MWPRPASDLVSWWSRLPQPTRLSQADLHSPPRAVLPQERKKEAESAALAEAAAKEAAAKDAAAAAAAGMPLPTANERKKDKGPPPPEFDEKAEQEYLKLEARFKAQLGLMPAEANGGPGH